MNVNQIEIALSQKITESSSNFDLLAASKALSFLKTNGVFVVSSYGGLPSAASNEGKIYFIEDIETVVWSNGTDWLKLLDKSAFERQLFGWGANGGGRIGDGTATTTCSPVREFYSATNWCQVSAANFHTAAIKTSGELWTAGYASFGRLATGGTGNSASFVREFYSATDWCQVSSNGNASAAIKTSGQLWSWGFGACGRLGDGTLTTRCSPVREFCSATDWCGVSAGYLHTSALKTSGELWAWGRNICFNLGDGTGTNRCSPVREICSATNWCQVSAGCVTTAAVKTSGELWSWGSNAQGSIGDATTTDKCSPVREICSATDWCQVSVGARQTTAIKTSGQLWAWGHNNCGQLGDGTTTTSRCSPVREFCSATDWCKVEAGFYHTSAIKTSGQLWVWGRNSLGQLGDGTLTARCSPVREISSSTDWNQVSGGCAHTAAIKIV